MFLEEVYNAVHRSGDPDSTAMATAEPAQEILVFTPFVR